MGGQALAGGDVGMVAADQVDVFIGGVQLALLGCGGNAGGGGLDQAGLFQVFEGVFQTTPLGFFIGVVVVGGLGGFVQAFGEGKSLFELGNGIVHIQHFAVGVLVLCADEYAFPRPYGAPAVGSEFKAFAVFSTFFSTAVDDVAEVELGFLVVGGEFDVFLTFLVFHPEFVVRPGTDDVPCVPIGRDVVGMGAVVHDAGDIRTVGVALDEGQHDFGAFV